MTTSTSQAATSWSPKHVNVRTRVFDQSADAVRHVVLMIENLIRERHSAGLHCVLGLPTGSTPIGVYRELVRLHKEEGLDFSNVVTFNIDEYYPSQPDQVQSVHRIMHENLFSQVNIRPENVHIPDGTLGLADMDRYCEDYENLIRRVGGIDLLLLGIGRTGHIGFNEPGALTNSRTHLARLDPVTRRDAANSFYGEENVPTHAITMGVGTILEAKRVVLMAFGEHKAAVIRRALEEKPSENCPASLIGRHTDASFVIDQPAASELTVVKTPWLVGRVRWTELSIRKAVLWLAFKENKALLKLTDEDFRKNELYELIREHGPVEQLCQRVFDNMMATICQHPAGHTPRRVLCFSPHPDDDVISMGGTLIRLQQQGHDVHIAYMTSGNVAVFDHDALRFADFVSEFNSKFGIESQKTRELEQRIYQALANKRAGDKDAPEVLEIKGLVRKSEATSAAKMIKIEEPNLHFIDLPFYRTGRVSKNKLSPDDVAIVFDLLLKVEPAQIYVAGDLADPHGTHRVCADACFQAVEQYRALGKDLEVWLYRGAWQEFEPHQIERAVPISPSTLELKKLSIFCHESQKDRAMFPGDDAREFWQRAEDRNRSTAGLYDKLGLPEFYALEGFVQWHGGAI